MNRKNRKCTLCVSESFFRLVTESLRLRSNETSCLQTLSDFIDSRVREAQKITDHDAATLRDHLSIVPTSGPIEISFVISADSSAMLVSTRERLDFYLGSELSLGDTVSVILFDYVVDQKARRVLSTLGLDEPADKHGELTANDSQ